MPEAVKSRRVITFVPAENASDFAKSIAADIPHLFGEYDSVCWWSEPKTEAGIEQFRPLESEIEQTPSVRMEFSVPDDDKAVTAFVEKIKQRHPWKEPVILIHSADIIRHK